MMAGSAFYDQSALGQVAINLFHGWGYNFYREENLLRGDDLLIRAKAGVLLGQARAGVEKAEAAYRRALPAPTRAAPFPDAAALAGAQALERLSRAIGALEAQIRAQPAPENDRMSQLYRSERGTLMRLCHCDERLVGQAEVLRAAVDGRDGAATIAALPELEAGLAAISTTLRERQAILLSIA